MSRPQNIEQKSVLGTSKIKIEEDSDSVSQVQNKSNENIPLQQPILDKQAKKSEELIESIKTMYLKIQGEKPGSLR